MTINDSRADEGMLGLNRDAWFLSQVTSPRWLETIAETSDALGKAGPTEWRQRCSENARTVRLCASAIERGGRVPRVYLELHETLERIVPDVRVYLEQGVRFEESDPTMVLRDRLSWCVEATKLVLANNVSAGADWVNGDVLTIRNKGITGETGSWLQQFERLGMLVIPDPFPTYIVDYHHSCRPGELCPMTGIWAPSQGMDRCKLAFGVAGRLMPPAFEIQTQADLDHDVMASLQTNTVALETEWHAVQPQ